MKDGFFEGNHKEHHVRTTVIKKSKRKQIFTGIKRKSELLIKVTHILRLNCQCNKVVKFLQQSNRRSEVLKDTLQLPRDSKDSDIQN